MEEFPKTYDPKNVEKKLYDLWEHSGAFVASGSGLPYAVVMPPPNVTGILHMGHALVNTLQDILVRRRRMQGYATCWIPGTDHAGIATQTVVERHLYATYGKRRTEFSREEFLQHIWDWKEKSEKVILSQLRQLGCSCDWSRQHFTMEPLANRAVKKAFKMLFDRGVIYRGHYLVNWDPVLRTALADDEVEYEERNAWLYYLRYRLVNSDSFLTVATTRPETLLGDTAIAVSPQDPRYAHLIGQMAHLPFVNRQIPIIADDSVDPEFGTGAVKITPAHDKDDYQIGLKHGLPMINILTCSGMMNENGGPFIGQSKEEARENILGALEQLGLFEKKEPYALRVGISYRSGAVIEPYLSKQWFVAVEEFRDSLREFVTEDSIRIFPPEFKRNYIAWVNNLRDWCISRQLWWGHQIPIWYCKKDEEKFICYDGEGLPEEVLKNPDDWYQDPDVLDTWFSSGLWPLTCLGWPDETTDFKTFYPNAVLVTGHDILFFWVTRMVLLCSAMVGEKPFTDVFLHGLIFGKSYKCLESTGEWVYISGEEKHAYDMGQPLPDNVVAKWEKLSKSKGNVIDPIEMISQYGADAVRMTLCSCANRGEQIDLDYRLFEEYRNFVNKLWNGARFVFSHIVGLSGKDLLEGVNETSLGLEDFYIIDRFNQLIRETEKSYQEYAFDKIASLAYEFFRKDLCSTYLEVIKPILFGKQGTVEHKQTKCRLLAALFINVLGILHPIIPFVTEEIFLKVKEAIGPLPDGKGDAITGHAIEMLRAQSCILAAYPKEIAIDLPHNVQESFALAERLVYVIRNIRGEMQLDPRQLLEAFVISDASLDTYFPIMCALGGLASVVVLTEAPKGRLYSLGMVDQICLGIMVPGEHLSREKARLEKEQTRIRKVIENTERLLGSENFRAKANPELVRSKEESLKNARIEFQRITEKLSTL